MRDGSFIQPASRAGAIQGNADRPASAHAGHRAKRAYVIRPRQTLQGNSLPPSRRAKGGTSGRLRRAGRFRIAVAGADVGAGPNRTAGGRRADPGPTGQHRISSLWRPAASLAISLACVPDPHLIAAETTFRTRGFLVLWVWIFYQSCTFLIEFATNNSKCLCFQSHKSLYLLINSR